MAKITNDCLPCLGNQLSLQSLPIRTQEILLNSWSAGTKKQYSVYVLKWIKFPNDKNYNTTNPTVSELLQFFTELFDNGMGYSALNTARTALSTSVNIKDSKCDLGEDPLVKRFFKGVFRSRPSFPRYQQTWDVSIVISYLKTKSPAAKLTLQELTFKLVTLCFLVTGQRCQTIHLMNIDSISHKKSSTIFQIFELVKHSRPGIPQPELVLPGYPPDRRLCVVTYLKEYLRRTAELRHNNKLFISYTKPHKYGLCSTISRWVTTTLQKSGIDINKFSAHSTRAASTSATYAKNVPLDHIMKNAGWTKKCTFSKYYNKPVTNNEQFALAILQD